MICDEARKDDERIVVIHKKNGGLSAARNTGLDMMKGDFIYFVDGDDMIHPFCIEYLMRLMRDYGADIVQCAVQAFLDENRIKELKGRSDVEKYDGISMCKKMLFDKDASDCTVVWNKLYKREIYEDIRFPEGRIYEDVAVTHKAYWKSELIIVTKEELSYYRSLRKNSITHSGHKSYGDQILAARERCLFFKENKARDLYEQSLYLLCNDYARYRVYNDISSEEVRISKEHHKLWREVQNTSLSLKKKILVHIGVRSPKAWYYFWQIKKMGSKIKRKGIIMWKLRR